LLVALLDGPLDESLDLFVGLQEAVLESAGLLSTHPEDPGQTLTTCTERRISDSCSTVLASIMERSDKGDIDAKISTTFLIELVLLY